MSPPKELDASTRRPASSARIDPANRLLRLTIAFHPTLRRVGERADLVADGDGIALSRRTPEFHAPDGRLTGPLGDSYLSRSPVVLRPCEGGVVVERGASSTPLRVVGAPATSRVFLDASALAYGAVLTLADRVVLILQECPPASAPSSGHGLTGASAALEAVRRHIDRCAPLQASVLIQGESGTGKELIARAIHAASPRAGRPYVPINMAALNPHTAVAELFGHARGSFTGALEAREGLFRAADGGTLFLDEIAAASLEVQAMLLRVLEVGEIQPLGGSPARRVDVRVLTATDADLTQSIRQGGFRAALYHRLAAYELPVPPLRARRDDIARLFVHFLELELQRAGRPECFEGLAEDASKRLPVAAVAQLLAHAWPGNVRELRNVAVRAAAALLVGDDIGEVVAGEHEAQPPGSSAPAQPPASSLLDDELLRAALAKHGWQVASAARELGISRNTLYARIRSSEHLHTAPELPRAVLEPLYARHNGDIAAIAGELGVSVRALKLRLRALELIQ
jgi:two-component system nitrogen regulation response regulator GlnG